MAIGKDSETQASSSCKPGAGHTVAFDLGAFNKSSLDAPVQIVILGSQGCRSSDRTTASYQIMCLHVQRINTGPHTVETSIQLEVPGK
jgi:hypothetical protein